jgi:hypothetical protein
MAEEKSSKRKIIKILITKEKIGTYGKRKG